MPLRKGWPKCSARRLWLPSRGRVKCAKTTRKWKRLLIWHWAFLEADNVLAAVQKVRIRGVQDVVDNLALRLALPEDWQGARRVLPETGRVARVTS
mmetsp:Transcript_23443/g.61622  ORF Transcript_23443/g.61622 Transcript_23443/m.61622 type:complete len:96 (-) Transcript_23443:49-336(-)